METLIRFIPATLILVFIYLTTNAKKMKFKKPVNGRLTSPFGKRINPVTKKDEFHNGVDLAVPVGTPIVCPMDGYVSSIYSNDVGGKQMIIQHDNGFKTGYAHLETTKAYLSQHVKAGDVVATSGNSGRSTGPHLHFTLTDASGNKVNPVDYFL